MDYRQQMPGMMQPQFPGQMMMPQLFPGHGHDQGDGGLNQRVNQLERQVQRLQREQERINRRLSRLENQSGWGSTGQPGHQHGRPEYDIQNYY